MDPHALFVRMLVGPLWAAWEHSPYLRHYRRLRQAQYDSPEAIRDRQRSAVLLIVAYARRATSFYKKRLEAAGVAHDRTLLWNDFARIPVLTKADIRSHGPEMRVEGIDRSKLVRKTTSGSTGVSLEVWVDEASMQFKRACTLRSDEWSGWRFGESTAMIWGNPEFVKHGWRGRLRNTLLERKRYLDTLKMDQATMLRFADDLARRPPSLIFGHAHSVFLFAEFVRRQELRPIRPKGIITSAMILHDWQRRKIEEVFACEVTNRYGCEEVSLIACECERHEGLHVNCDGVYVELLRDGQPVGPGEPGSVIVTDLSNRAMPMIRYQVGDVATCSARTCSCGRGFPLLERVEGREADYVTTTRGELISGISLTENFALQVPGIAQLQIIQEERDRFVFRIVRGKDFGQASLERISGLVAERFGTDARFNCEYLDNIAAEPSGKYRFCISRVPNVFTSGVPAEALSR